MVIIVAYDEYTDSPIQEFSWYLLRVPYATDTRVPGLTLSPTSRVTLSNAPVSWERVAAG